MKLGIDIGGTFTDLVLLDEASGALQFAKTSTTPDDPTNGIVRGVESVLDRAGVGPASVTTVVHGTTLVTNAVIERTGARTGLLTTAGFEDVLEIGRELRYDIYDLFLERPDPLVPRRLRLGVEERIAADGSVVTPLNRDQLASAAERLVSDGVESVAVCYLHAFANPEHERATVDFLREHYPDLTVSCSSAVMPQIREYERASATVMNAYVQPLTTTYLARLEDRLAEVGVSGVLQVMLSSGRLTTVEGAQATPIHLLESGPAGGTRAGVFWGQKRDDDNVLCFDMGGTTAKASLVHNCQPKITNEFEAARKQRFKKGSGLPVRIPTVDMIEIGAGGGSLAQVNDLGLLEVGPASAGSDPGPACYGRGGAQPTVTDADLVLGYLNPDTFLGGEMALDPDAARHALRTHVADPLDISVEAAALGIHRVVNENMANAAREHVLEKGQDPRRYTLMAYGGAGPVHASRVARLLGTQTVVVPVGAGVTSALGFLTTPVATERTQSQVRRLNQMDWDTVRDTLERLEAEGRAFVRRADVSTEDIVVERRADMRYSGQGHEITVPLPEGRLSADDVPAVVDNFETAYEERYGRLVDDVAIESVTWRVLVKEPTRTQPLLPPSRDPRVDAQKGRRSVRFPERDAAVDCPIYDRYALAPGTEIYGPAIVEERESTVVAGPHSIAHVDSSRNLVLDVPTKQPDACRSVETTPSALFS